MLEVALVYFGASIAVFIVLVLVTSKERRLGRRLFAVSVREKMDIALGRGWQRSADIWSHFMKYIVQLHWYYSIHSVLKGLLHIIVAIYTRVESVFERNRQRAKRLRKEKQQQAELSHLAQVSVHKEETALTPAQKRKLREKELEGKH